MPVLDPENAVVARLRARRPEIEQALLAQTSAVQIESSSKDPEYQEGFRAAVSAGFDFSLAVIEGSGERPPPVPAPIISQAGLAARNSVGLGAVLCRYHAGSSLLDDFIFNEIDHAEWEPLRRSRDAALQLLLAEVSAEYERVTDRRSRSRDARGLERVQRLLQGIQSTRANSVTT